MATTFPTSLDAFSNPAAGTILDGAGTAALSHATQHANANDAIEAIQTAIGVTNSAVPSSIQYKLSNATMPVGTQVQNYLPGASFGPAWLALDGSSVSKTTYAAVAALFPSTFSSTVAKTNAYTPTAAPAVAYGNGMFVCVGGTVAAATSAASSPDGTTWTLRAMNTSAVWGSGSNQDTTKSLVFVGGSLNRFIAVGSTATNTTAYNSYSTNGTTWTAGGALPAGLTTTQLSLATDGVANVVVVSKSLTARAIGYSSNGGTTWTLATLTGSSVAGVLTCVWSPFLSLFVVTAAGHPGYYWTSPTGATWTQRTAPAYTSASVLQVLVNNSSELVMFSPSGYVVSVAADGTTWTDITNQFPDDVSKISVWAGQGKSIGNFTAITIGTETRVLTDSRLYKKIPSFTAFNGLAGSACTNGTIWLGVNGTTFGLSTFTISATNMQLDSTNGVFLKVS